MPLYVLIIFGNPLLIFFFFKNISNSFACMTITIWITSFSHRIIRFWIFKKFFKIIVNRFFISTNKS